MSDEWKTIKLRRETYEKLKNLGGESISKSINDLINAATTKVESAVQDTKKIAEQLALYLVQHGYFDIKFRNFNIYRVVVEGDIVKIEGGVSISIPNREVLDKVVQMMRDRGVKVEGVS